MFNVVQRQVNCGGGGEIRTLEGLTPSPVFKTGAFNRSATPPRRGPILLENAFQSTTESLQSRRGAESIAFEDLQGIMALAGLMSQGY